MRRRTMIGTTTATVLALLLGATTIGAVAPAVAADTGSVRVQLTDPSGTAIRQAGVTIAAIGERDIAATGTTDGAGLVVLGGIAAPDTVTVTTRAFPPLGAGTYAPGQHTGIPITAGTTSTTTIPLVVGATVAGTITGPGGALAGKTLFAFNGDTAQAFQTTSDATGHYEFVGLSTGPYRIEAYTTIAANPATWKTRVYQQRGALPPSHATLSQHYVHTDYDFVAMASSPGYVPAPELSGATVRIVSTTTGATWSTTFSTLLDSEQTAQFQVPTGHYLVELLTVATPTAPARDLWLGRTDTGYAYLPGRVQAIPVNVVFGGYNGWGGTVPPAS